MNKRRGPNHTGPPARGFTPRPAHEDSVRSSAMWVLERTLDTGAPTDVYLERAQERYDRRDRGLLLELVQGTLRWLRRLDSIISAASNRRFETIEPALRAPLRIGAYQLLFLDRIPAHAAVNEAVEQARRRTHRGGASFANAVLRRIARSPSPTEWTVKESDPIRRLAIEMSHPDFLVKRWVERFGRRQTQALLRANNRSKPLQILAFRDRGGRELLAESLIDEGIEVSPSAISPLGLTLREGDLFSTEAFRRGDFYIQDEASQVAALFPPPRPGERILDAAAAPGGKSFAMLAYEPNLRLVAADTKFDRLARLGSNLARLGREVPILVADAGRPPFTRRADESDLGDPAVTTECFDRVVLDLPCSGTGTLRKNPELKWRIDEGEIGRLSRQALRMMRGSAPTVAEGGLLIAITCSVEREENEDVIARFLEREAGFRLLPLEDLVPQPLDQAIVGPGFWRLLTGGDHDGFSVHVLERHR